MASKRPTIVCVNCKWYKELVSNTIEHRCYHPDLEEWDIITGNLLENWDYYYQVRNDEHKCGQVGKWFEEK